MLGGLISGHLLALDHYGALIPGGYKNQLLQLAYDLGRRLMPSFDTPTGIPYAWINLKVLCYIPRFNILENFAKIPCSLWVDVFLSNLSWNFEKVKLKREKIC